MRVLLFFLFFIYTNVTYSSFPTKETADSLYAIQQYEEAAQIYESLIKTSPSDELFYNLGNTYYQLKKIGYSVLSYERALHLNPTHQDAQYNLSVIRQQIPNQIDVLHKNLFSVLITRIRNSFSIFQWTVGSFFLLGFLFILGLNYHLSPSLLSQKISLWAALIITLLFFLFFFFTAQQQFYYQNNTRAVVVLPSIKTYQSPTLRSEALKPLHEGTTVEITETSPNGWIEVELPNKRRVWLQEKQIKRIATKL